MSVPNMSAEVKRLHDTGLFNLKTHEGQGAFTDACVSMLHGIDPNWGHLIKKPGQTDVHDHGEDSALYKLPNGKATAVDFIGGAGGPNPQPGWGVDTFPYTHADWFDSTDHGIYDGGGSAPSPTYPPYTGDAAFDAVGALMFGDYAAAGYGPDSQMGRWFGRTIYDWLALVVPSLDDSIMKHQLEWRDGLNQRRASEGLPPIAW